MSDVTKSILNWRISCCNLFHCLFKLNIPFIDFFLSFERSFLLINYFYFIFIYNLIFQFYVNAFRINSLNIVSRNFNEVL